MNIYEQQQKNKRLTVILIIVFVLFFIIIGLGFDYFYLNLYPAYINENGDEVMRRFVPYGTIFCLILSLILVINAFSNGIKSIIKATGAIPPNPDDIKEKQFIDVVEEMSIAAGIPKPAAYIVPDSDLNAFATGFSPEKSYIFATRGLVDNLNREELQAVVAHEMSHIRFYDIRLLTVTTVLMNAIALISDMIWRSSRSRGYSSSSKSSSSKSKNSGGVIIFFIWIILLILAPIISRILAMAISRQREYLADAGAAELTRNPKALISALEKIRSAVEPTKMVKDGVANMCIADPRGSLIEEKTGFIADLFATHPPMEKRILALKLMAYEKQRDTGK
ncbi:MAG: M48 family metalloprotease [Elusimicrobia bacterium]|nr:M48 family metalloprotease [Elusimicrobiota bacterium]